jgi:catechol 2,3-dioxygenase-like lactoylglutathione lyase family enzyme
VSGVVDLIPFLLVTDVERSIAFYEALGFSAVERYVPDDALRERLIASGYEPGEIGDGSPGPEREMCVTDPDGHGHMVAERR